MLVSFCFHPISMGVWQIFDKLEFNSTFSECQCRRFSLIGFYFFLFCFKFISSPVIESNQIECIPSFLYITSLYFIYSGAGRIVCLFIAGCTSANVANGSWRPLILRFSLSWIQILLFFSQRGQTQYFLPILFPALILSLCFFPSPFSAIFLVVFVRLIWLEWIRFWRCLIKKTMASNKQRQ